MTNSIPDTKATWRTVAAEEIRDLWVRGPGLWVLLVLAIILSVSTIVLARTAAVNLLDAREGALVLVKLASGLGAVLALLYGADALSGERDRGTLEPLLLTPVARRDLVIGKLVAALTLWVAGFALTIPYLSVVGMASGITGAAVIASGIAGALASLFLGSVGIAISVRSRSNRSSLLASLLVLAILTFPGLIPSSSVNAGFVAFVTRADPIASLLRFLNGVVVDELPISAELDWLPIPALLAVGAVLIAAALGRQIALEPGKAE